MPTPVLVKRVLKPDEEPEEFGAELSETELELGEGQASSPVVHQGEGGRRSAVTQGEGGSITSQELNYPLIQSGRQSWRQILKVPRATAN